MKINFKIYKKVKGKMVKINELITKSCCDSCPSYCVVTSIWKNNKKFKKYDKNRICSLKECLWKMGAFLTLQIEEMTFNGIK